LGDVDCSALGDHPNEFPTLQPAPRPTLDDLDQIARLRLFLFVVNVANGASVHDPAILRVPNDTRDLDPPRLARGGTRDRSCFHSLGHLQ
jgi:hypothetical protein